MNSFKKQCLTLRTQDKTLNEIVQITGRPKTSVFFHIQHIPLSLKKQHAIQKASGDRARALALGRKGKSLKPFKKSTTWNTDTVRVVAHLLFDGEISSRACCYYNRNKSLLDAFEQSMTSFYDFEAKRYTDKKTGVRRISYFNVELAAYMRTKVPKLLHDIVTMPKHLKKTFLKAFFDDEGCVDFNNNKRRVRGYQHNTEILQLIQKLLTTFHIQSTVDTKYYELTIGRRENLERFHKEINFSHGVRINGKRTNSVWKQNLEKRTILKKALTSYQKIS